jgi:hypothetical protein
LYNSRIYIYTDTGAWRDTGFAPTLDVWTHIAFVRNGSTLKMYANGTEEWSVSNSVDYDENSAFKMGQHSDYYQGYIDEFRLSIGVARWSANFTPPTAPYTGMKGQGVSLVNASGINGTLKVNGAARVLTNGSVLG